MKLDDYLATLPSWQRDKFNAKLNSLTRPDSLMTQFALNLREECRLNRHTWERVVEAVDAADPTPEQLKAKVTEVFRGFPWEGGEIPLPWPTRFGRAMDRGEFTSWLSSNPNIVSKDADRFVDGIIGEPVEEVRDQLGTVPFSRFPMWATFNDNAPDTNPFSSMLPPDATGIRIRLGLSMNSSELLLLVYALPAGIAPHYPTVANAYAGATWFSYFRPSHESHQCGFTQPHEIPLGTPAQPCPEVIHAPISAEALEEPLQIARP